MEDAGEFAFGVADVDPAITRIRGVVGDAGFLESLVVHIGNVAGLIDHEDRVGRGNFVEQVGIQLGHERRGAGGVHAERDDPRAFRQLLFLRA